MRASEIEDELRSLLLAARGGERNAYRAFLSKIAPRLRAFIRGQFAKVGRAEAGETEDVLQETLLALHLAQHTYDASSPVTAWAHAIARYKVIDHLRASSRAPKALPIEDAEHALAREDHASTETRLDLTRALASLPPRTRRLIEEVKIGGASIAETAARAGMSESAVKVALHRGLKALAKTLAGRGTGSRAPIPHVTDRTPRANSPGEAILLERNKP